LLSLIDPGRRQFRKWLQLGSPVQTSVNPYRIDDRFDLSLHLLGVFLEILWSLPQFSDSRNFFGFFFNLLRPSSLSPSFSRADSTIADLSRSLCLFNSFDFFPDFPRRLLTFQFGPFARSA
jgi:hypothetical protein